MLERERRNDHQKFKELAALAQGRALTGGERIELKRHLELCSACRAISGEYSLLGSQGMTFLAADGGHVAEAEAWNDRARMELFSRIQEPETSDVILTEALTDIPKQPPRRASFLPTWSARAKWAAV